MTNRSGILDLRLFVRIATACLVFAPNTWVHATETSDGVARSGAEESAPESAPEPTASPTAEPTPESMPAPDPTVVHSAPGPVRFVEPGIPPPNRLVLNGLVAIRYNPLGLETQFRAGWQMRLYASEAPISRDNFLFLGVLPKLNPASTMVGPAIEVQPLSILNVRASAGYVRYFSTFGYLQSFPTPRVEYSDTLLEEYEDQGAHYAGSGVHAAIEPTVQLKVGNVVVRNKFALGYWDMDLRDGDSVFYEASLDTLVPGKGYVLGNDFDVLYLTDFGLTAGVRHTYVRPVYGRDDFLPGEDTRFHRNRHHRMGVLAAYTFHDHGYTRFNKPTVLMITSWYLNHRWRTGEDVGQGVPYVILGFAFQTDLLDR